MYYCTTSINTDNPNSRYLRPSTLRPAQDLCQGVLVLSIHGKVGRVRYRAIVLPTLAKVVVKHRDRRCYDIVRHPWDILNTGYSQLLSPVGGHDLPLLDFNALRTPGHDPGAGVCTYPDPYARMCTYLGVEDMESEGTLGSHPPFYSVFTGRLGWVRYRAYVVDPFSPHSRFGLFQVVAVHRDRVSLFSFNIHAGVAISVHRYHINWAFVLEFAWIVYRVALVGTP